MGILETSLYPGFADKWFQRELFQQLHAVFIGSLSLYCTQLREGLLAACITMAMHTLPMCMGIPGRTNSHALVDRDSRGWLTVSVGRFEQLLQLLY